MERTPNKLIKPIPISKSPMKGIQTKTPTIKS